MYSPMRAPAESSPSKVLLCGLLNPGADEAKGLVCCGEQVIKLLSQILASGTCFIKETGALQRFHLTGPMEQRLQVPPDLPIWRQCHGRGGTESPSASAT